jgi:phage antirepressor YoqD-like protein
MADTQKDNGVNMKIPTAIFRKGSDMTTFARSRFTRKFSGSNDVLRNVCSSTGISYEDLDLPQTATDGELIDDNGWLCITEVNRQTGYDHHNWLRTPRATAFVEKLKEAKGLPNIHVVRWRNTYVRPEVGLFFLMDMVNVKSEFEPLRKRLINRLELECDYGKKAMAIAKGEFNEDEFRNVEVITKTPEQLSQKDQYAKNIYARIQVLDDPLSLRDSSDAIGFGQTMFIKWLSDRGYITKQSFYAGGKSYWHASPVMVEKGYMINNRFKAHNKAEVNQTKITPKGLAFIFEEMDSEDTFVL